MKEKKEEINKSNYNYGWLCSKVYGYLQGRKKKDKIKNPTKIMAGCTQGGKKKEKTTNPTNIIAGGTGGFRIT